MRHGKVEANHPRMIIFGLRRWIIAIFERPMLRWSIGHHLADPVVIGLGAFEARQNSLSQLTQPAYSVHGMSSLNPLGYVRSQFPAEILIFPASVHLLWKLCIQQRERTIATKMNKEDVDVHWSFLFNLNLILAGGCIATKYNVFHLGYFPNYLSYRICKFVFFFVCRLSSSLQAL